MNDVKKIRKKISPDLQSKLDKTYEPHSRLDFPFRSKAVTLITDERGEPVTLFIGRRLSDGSIKGEHYTRRIKERTPEGKIKTSHWDRKGKVG